VARRKHKVLLIGATGYQRTGEDFLVDCCLWTKVKTISNIRDYDTIILDLLSIKRPEERAKIDWNNLYQVLNFSDAFDILFNGGKIILIGDPRFRIPVPNVTENKSPDTQVDQPFLYWTGIRFLWDSKPGDTLFFEDDYKHRKLERYVSHLNKWEYSLDRCEVEIDTLKQYLRLPYLEQQDIAIDLSKDYFCHNRYKNALAFILNFQYITKGGKYSSREVLKTFGPIYFLPEISLPSDDTRQIVLNDICGVEADLPEPEWIKDYRAPGQKEIDEEIREIEGEIESILKRLEDANIRRAKARDCLKLLYEREYALEPTVRDLLRSLGAHVEDPSEPNKEDGWIVVRVGDKILEGVLEVKSTKADQFSEEGRKQLLDWIDRGRTLRSKNYKGIFIGNSAVDKPLKERPWAFSDSWSKAAELSGICAIKTEDIYIIYLLNSAKEIDLNEFWEQLFSTNGIFDMTKFWESLGPKEKK
jgi:hypothetical protein